MIHNVIRLACLFCFFQGTILAQHNENNRFAFGLKLGAGISNTTESININEGSMMGFMGNAGVTFLIPITPKLISLTPEVNYALRFFKEDDMDNSFYQINYLEIPVICNVRLWEIKEFYGHRTINLEFGLGYGKPLSSKLRTDSSKPADGLPGGWYEYDQLEDQFEKGRTQYFWNLGVNSRLIGEKNGVVGLRFTRMLTGLYEDNPALTSYNLEAKAYSLSIEFGVYF